ncbi:MAG: DUF4352 domain-containing protein [Ectobacillus sp.]
MKKALLLIAAAAMLGGCSANAAEKNAKTEKMEEQEVKKAEESPVHNQATEYVPSSQIVDDAQLLQVGQSIANDKGIATVKAIKQVEQTVQIGAVDLVIHDVKIIDYTPSYGMIDFFHGYTHDEQFHFVKLNVEVQNTSSKKVKFAPIAVLETSTGEQKHWDDDIYLENINGELAPSQGKRGNLGFILEGKQPESIKWIKVTTSDLVDEEHKVVEGAKEIRIDME